MTTRPQKLTKEQVLQVLDKEYHRIQSYVIKHALEKNKQEALEDFYNALNNKEVSDAYDSATVLDQLGWSVNYKLTLLLDDLIYKINTTTKKLQIEWIKLNNPVQKLVEYDTVTVLLQNKEYVGQIVHINKVLAQYVVNIPELHSTKLDNLIIDWEDPNISRLENTKSSTKE